MAFLFVGELLLGLILKSCIYLSIYFLVPSTHPNKSWGFLLHKNTPKKLNEIYKSEIGGDGKKVNL